MSSTPAANSPSTGQLAHYAERALRASAEIVKALLQQDSQQLAMGRALAAIGELFDHCPVAALLPTNSCEEAPQWCFPSWLSARQIEYFQQLDKQQLSLASRSNSTAFTLPSDLDPSWLCHNIDPAIDGTALLVLALPEPLVAVAKQLLAPLVDQLRQGQLAWQQRKRIGLVMENASIAIWHEDQHLLAVQFAALRKRGIENLGLYLDQHPEQVHSLASLIRIVKLNRACRQLFTISDSPHFAAFNDTIRRRLPSDYLRKKLLAIWQADSKCAAEITLAETGDSPTQHVIMTFQLPQGRPGQNLVPVSIVDITSHKNTELHLKELLLRYELVIEGAYGAVWDWDVREQHVHYSKQWCEMRGLERSDLQSNQGIWLQTIHPEDRQRVLEAVEDHFAGNSEFFEQEYRIDAGQGRGWRWITDRGICQRDETGRVVRMAGSEFDITEQRERDAQLRLNASVFEHAAEGVMILDASGTIVDINAAFGKILGYPKEQMLGTQPADLCSIHGHSPDSCNSILTNLEATGSWHGEASFRAHDLRQIPCWLTLSVVRDQSQNITHYVGMILDISQIKHSEQLLYNLAHHDSLTGLPNRILLSERLEQATLRAARRDQKVAVVFIDLDNFKFINDSLGHAAGDQLLQKVAANLTSTVRAEDTVSRIGGDEFILILGDLERDHCLASVANKLLGRVTEFFTLEGRDVRVSASLGVSVYPDDGEDATTLIRNADTAMYQAKQSGKQNFKFYTQELTDRAFERMQLESDLHRALERGELELFYQPQIGLKERCLIGLEALLRWRHSEFGMVGPDKFIPLAEETGLIEPIGEWVIQQTCRQARKWLDMGLEFGTIGINIAGRQIQQGQLPQQVAQALAASRLPPHKLELEVTEGFIMQQASFAIDQLQQLRELGVVLAIDDFGTGYSSLSYLKQLPIHRLKIDKSFIGDIPEDSNDVAITEAIIAMAERLGLEVIAEGVETQAQADFLLQNGCPEGQGYLFSRPCSCEDVTKLLPSKE